jgi:hypothetical protein
MEDITRCVGESVPRNPRQDTRARTRPASECTRVNHANRSESSQNSRATMACSYCPFTGAVRDAEGQHTRGWCGVLESEASLPPLAPLARRSSGKLSEWARSKRYPPHLQGCAFVVCSGIAPPGSSMPQWAHWVEGRRVPVMRWTSVTIAASKVRWFSP